jgi:pimeloyl-ACP methyl ester carboxylesterase
MVSHACWQDLGKRLPTAYMREIQGAGHMAFATHADQIAQEVARFAAKVYLAA